MGGLFYGSTIVDGKSWYIVSEKKRLTFVDTRIILNIYISCM